MMPLQHESPSCRIQACGRPDHAPDRPRATAIMSGWNGRDRGSIGCSLFHGGIGTPIALIGEMAEHPGQCPGPAIMGAPGNCYSQHGFQNVNLLVPILGQLGYGVGQHVLDSFNLLLRLHGWSPQSASHNGIIRNSLRTIRFAGSASSSPGHCRRCLGRQRPSPDDGIHFPVLKIEHDPTKYDDDRHSCYKFDQGYPFHDYWWRFEAEPFKPDHAISSLFRRMSIKKGLLTMSLKYSVFEGHLGVTLISAVHVHRLAYEVFDA
jgi:hypothetical protein